MGKTKRLLALLMCLALLLGLLGCGNTASTPTTPSTEATDVTKTTEATQTTEPSTPTEPAVADVYTQAAAPLRAAQNLKVQLSAKKSIVGLGDKISTVSEQELVLTGIGTDSFAAKLSESLGSAGYKDEFTEYFADGVLFMEVNNADYFQGKMTAKEFIARFAPAVLLDESLYGEISAEEAGSGAIVTFSDPSGPESWALPQGAKFLSAGGTAEIIGGKLSKTVYTLEYTQGSTTVSLEVTAKAETCDNQVLQAPADADSYIEVEAIQAIRLYNDATLYLICGKTASATIDKTIVSQAAEYIQMSQTQLHYTGTGKDHLSSAQHDYIFADNTGNTETYVLTEKFLDGQYTQSEDGGQEVSDSSVTAADVREYMQSLCVEKLPVIECFTSAKLENVNGLLYLEMGLNSAWGEGEEKELCYEIFRDENFLRGYASAYETVTATMFMTVDPATGFPVASGITYAGIHTIDGELYVLSEDVTKSYRLLDSSTYTELTDQVAPETAPEEQATPLLYRVTGADGQEMYLMGTIHVGDVKTGFLPEEVYAAFDASDALAVESNVPAFEEKLETDSQLAEKVGAMYVYADGSTIQDHLDGELYEQAARLLKITGNSDGSEDYLKPFAWESTISDFYLNLGGLRSEKGMDIRLLRLAREQNKKILEVEDALDSMEMLTGFSDRLQEELLKEAVSITAAEYCQDVQELYDLWCAGDETVLREMLQEEDAELTQEEQVLYEEYLQAMIIDRNENMLKVAISYLESGETVFYAVGLAHLLQENGLVDTLRETGYTVEQVLYGEAA